MIYKIKGTVTSANFIVILLILFSLVVLTPFLDIIIIGALFAYAIRPLALKIETKIPYRSLNIVLAMIILILPLIALLIFTIDSIINLVPEVIGVAQNTASINIDGKVNLITTILMRYIPDSLGPYIGPIVTILNSFIQDAFKGILNYLMDLITSLFYLAIDLLVFIATVFYLSRDGEKIWKYLISAIPKNRMGFFNKLYAETENVLISIFYGHFLTSLIIGLMAVLGYSLLGYPYALFLGIITGFFQFMPIIGPWPTYTALFIYDIFLGNFLRAALVLILGLILSGSDIYIRPKISGKYADMHPLIFLLGFLSGPLIWGFTGFILGPLILGVSYAALMAFKDESKNLDSVNKFIKS